MSLAITPYLAPGERYPSLIGVRADGDECETAYVSKSELADAVRERDELRELVRTIAFCAYADGCDCDECAMNGAEMRFEIDETETCDGMLDRLRELGIEVDE